VPHGTSSLGHLSPHHWPEPCQPATCHSIVATCHMYGLPHVSLYNPCNRHISRHVSFVWLPCHRTTLPHQHLILPRQHPYYHITTSICISMSLPNHLPRVIHTVATSSFHIATCHVHIVPRVTSIRCNMSLFYWAKSPLKKPKMSDTCQLLVFPCLMMMST
jgi:hypothetical protein